MEDANMPNGRRIPRPNSTSSLPLSLSASGYLEEEEGTAPSSRAISSTAEPTLDDTRSNLMMASTAIEAAIVRLQHIRSSLRQLDIRGTGSHSERPRIAEDNLAPAHAAIVLSDGENDPTQQGLIHPGLERAEATLPSAVESMLRIVRSNQSAVYSRLEREHEAIESLQTAFNTVAPAALSPASRRRHQYPHNPTAPPLSDGHSSVQPRTLPRRRSLLEMHLRRILARPDSSEESSTSLGRQVAARAASALNRSGSNTASRDRTSRQRSESLLLPTMTTSTDEEGTVRLPTDRPLLYDWSFSTSRGAFVPLDPPSPESESDGSVTTTEGRSTVAFPGRTATALDHQLAMVALRSGDALLNAAQGRARSWERGENRPATGMSRDLPDVDPAESRSYRVRRRLNSDGEEHVHHINMEDWWDGDDDDPNEWMIPTRDRLRTTSASSLRMRRTLDNVLTNRHAPAARVLRALNTTSRVGSQSAQVLLTENSSTTTRRRGWARLNADGDEIPTEEEEELERTRSTQRRARGSEYTRVDAATAARRARMEYLVPNTHTTFSSGTDDEVVGVGRVRLNLPIADRRGWVVWSDLSRDLSRDGDDAECGEPEAFESGVTFDVDPLPMPLDQMIRVVTPGLVEAVERVRVSRKSEMAAR